jgi:hypothetical protein
LEAILKSITIHGVDDHLAALLKKKAEQAGTSMNKTIKRLLEQAMGLKPRPENDRREVYEDFLGIWSEQDLAAFRAATSEMEQVDEADWR